jgi:hypothetical protein
LQPKGTSWSGQTAKWTISHASEHPVVIEFPLIFELDLATKVGREDNTLLQ